MMMPNWFAGDILANGMRTHYWRTGGEKPPLVLAHGLSDNGLCWTRLARALEDDYDLIMPDARGHGLSERVEARESVGLAADLAGLIEALGLEKPGVIGHSMGAVTAASLAARYPDLVACVILEDPPWREQPPIQPDHDEKGHLDSWRQRLIVIQTKRRDEVMALCREENPKWAEVELGPWADSKLQLDLNVFRASTLSFDPWQEIVPQITCPVLLITADPELGSIVTAATAQQVVQMLLNGQVVHISGAGHSIRRGQFEAYVEAVTLFLRENRRGLS